MKKKDLYYERIPTKLLRDDIRYLGNILGRVIKKQEGESFFNLVEKIRKLSKANKANNKGTYSFEIYPFRTPLGAKSRLPVRTQTMIIAGNKKTTEVPTKIPIYNLPALIALKSCLCATRGYVEKVKTS